MTSPIKITPISDEDEALWRLTREVADLLRDLPWMGQRLRLGQRGDRRLRGGDPAVGRGGAGLMTRAATVARSA